MLGKAVLLSREDTQVSSKRKETDDFFAAFSHQATEEQKTGLKDETIEIEVWETNIDIYEIFRILQNYLSEFYALDTYLMHKLILNRNLDLEDILYYIPYIHATFVDKILPKKEEMNGK